MVKSNIHPAGTVTDKGRSRSRASLFRYYIHDSAEAFRIQLLGELTADELPELNGCWNTANTTLQNRKLIVDVTGLKAVDEAGREWLGTMFAAGAIRVPYLPRAGAVSCPHGKEPGLVSRLISVFRNSRTVPAGSPTQVP